MGKRLKRMLKKDYEEDKSEASEAMITLCSSDEGEANEDLSLRIVEKATRLQAETLNQTDLVLLSSEDSGGSVIEFSSPSTIEVEQNLSDGTCNADLDTDENHANKSKKKHRLKKSNGIPKLGEKVQNVEIDKGAVDFKGTQSDKLEDPDAAEKSGNALLTKLLRGPRYFDPPEGNWETCYNCGEGGHLSMNCTIAKRKKPCFLCGNLDHSFKNCKKERDCFICRKSGHHPMKCPEKNKNDFVDSKMCLNCGDSGHDMFSCKNGYSHDDLKEIICYVCNTSGHLCCWKYVDNFPIEVSCYQCGLLGHKGLECKRSLVEAAASGSLSCCYKCGEEGHFARECMGVSRGKGLFSGSYGTGSPNLCYNCGQDGHFARECAKAGRKHTPLSTASNRDKGLRGSKSLPSYLDRRKKTRYDAPISRKPKAGRGWTTEHPGQFEPWRAKQPLRSPYLHTPSNKQNPYLATPSRQDRYSAISRFGGKPRRSDGVVLIKY